MEEVRTIINKEAPSVFTDLLEFWEWKEEKEAILKDIQKQFNRIGFEGGIETIKRDAIGQIATPGVTWFYQKRYPVKGKKELMFCGCVGEPDKIRPDLKKNKCSCIVKIDSQITDREIKSFIEKIKNMED